MVSTLKDNWENILPYRGTIFTNEFIQQIKNFVYPMTDRLRRLENKDTFVQDPSDTDYILYALIHTKVINCLLHNPDTFAHQPVKSLTAEAFKADLSHNDAIPKRFHPHAQAHGPAQGKHVEQQHVRTLPC